MVVRHRFFRVSNGDLGKMDGELKQIIRDAREMVADYKQENVRVVTMAIDSDGDVLVLVEFSH